jgi:hypothetical protein
LVTRPDGAKAHKNVNTALQKTMMETHVSTKIPQQGMLAATATETIPQCPQHIPHTNKYWH